MPNTIGTTPDGTEFYDRVNASVDRHKAAFGPVEVKYGFQEYPKAVEKTVAGEPVHAIVTSKAEEESFFGPTPAQYSEPKPAAPIAYPDLVLPIPPDVA